MSGSVPPGWYRAPDGRVWWWDGQRWARPSEPVAAADAAGGSGAVGSDLVAGAGAGAGAGGRSGGGRDLEALDAALWGPGDPGDGSRSVGRPADDAGGLLVPPRGPGAGVGPGVGSGGGAVWHDVREVPGAGPGIPARGGPGVPGAVGRGQSAGVLGRAAGAAGGVLRTLGRRPVAAVGVVGVVVLVAAVLLWPRGGGDGLEAACGTFSGEPALRSALAEVDVNTGGLELSSGDASVLEASVDALRDDLGARRALWETMARGYDQASRDGDPAVASAGVAASAAAGAYATRLGELLDGLEGIDALPVTARGAADARARWDTTGAPADGALRAAAQGREACRGWLAATGE